jgi:hypothetical protein
MNQIPVYREEFQTIIKEITANKGKVLRIVGNIVYFTDKEGNDCMFVPELTEAGMVFMKKDAVAPQEPAAKAS